MKGCAFRIVIGCIIYWKDFKILPFVPYIYLYIFVLFCFKAFHFQVFAVDNYGESFKGNMHSTYISFITQYIHYIPVLIFTIVGYGYIKF